MKILSALMYCFLFLCVHFSCYEFALNWILSKIQVIKLLLSIESTPLSVSTSRKVIISISRIQMGLSSGKISVAYIPLLFNGIIGILNKRFGHLWEPAIECLGVLLSKYVGIVWDRFIKYFENIQSTILISHGQGGILGSESQGSTIGMPCYIYILLMFYMKSSFSGMLVLIHGFCLFY